MAGEVAGRVTVVHTKAAAVRLNRPPEAAADRIAYPPTGSETLLVPLSRLRANDGDPDGDPLQLSSIDAPPNLVAEPDFTAGTLPVRLGTRWEGARCGLCFAQT